MSLLRRSCDKLSMLSCMNLSMLSMRETLVKVAQDSLPYARLVLIFRCDYSAQSKNVIDLVLLQDDKEVSIVEGLFKLHM